MMVMGTLGCAQTNGREGVDAAVDTREAPRDVHLNVDGDAYEVPGDAAMEVTRDSLCVGLDPASAECAREVLARIDRDACLDRLACGTTPIDPRICDVYNPEEGSWLVDGNRYQLVLVRLGRLRIDLDAAVCTLADRAFCGDGLDLSCGPLLVPTAEFTSCTQTDECGRDGYCAESDLRGCEVGVCRPRVGPGAPCDGGTPCAWGEGCVEGLCRHHLPPQRTATLGAPCGRTTRGSAFYSEWCVDGLGCAFDPPACVPVVSLGERCGGCPGPDCELCETSLRCESNVCVPFERVRAGDPCIGGGQGLCAPNTYGLLCEDGLCVTSEGRIGDVCRIPCIEGYCGYPEDDYSAPSRCLATRRTEGAYCTAIDECENGLCCGGVCVPVPE